MKKKLIGMIIGLIILVSFFYNLPVLAALVSKNITVQTGVNIYVNDNLLKPIDANGNPIESFIYNGTTYLPVRAIADAFNTDIKWEGKTGSVYVGKHISDKPAVFLHNLDYFTGEDLYFKTSDKDNLGNNRSNIVYGNKNTNVYKINGKYTSIAGTLFQCYDYRSSNNKSVFKIYGDDELLYEASMSGGIEPIDFNIDITGVLELKILFKDSYMISLSRNYYCYSGLSNCGLFY